MMNCGIIWLWLGSGILRARSILGHVRLSGRVSIESLGSGDVNSRLAMGWSGMGLVFVGLVRLG